MQTLIVRKLSKAFDTVCQDVLLQKLAYYGVRGESLELSHVKNRKELVDWKGEKSNIKAVLSGVPKDSVHALNCYHRTVYFLSSSYILLHNFYLSLDKSRIDKIEIVDKITLLADDTSILDQKMVENHLKSSQYTSKVSKESYKLTCF